MHWRMEKGKLHLANGDVYASWYGEAGWRHGIQIVPLKIEIGHDVERYARSARDWLRKSPPPVSG